MLFRIDVGLIGIYSVLAAFVSSEGSVRAQATRPEIHLTAPFAQAAIEQHQFAWSKHLRCDVEWTNSLGMKFRLIPPGEFVMGGDQEDSLAAEYEYPQHRVRLKNPFYMGSHEVTKKQYAAFVKAENDERRTITGGRSGWGTGWNDQLWEFEAFKAAYTWNYTGWEPYDDYHSVVNVSWNDAREFVRWLSQKEGRKYRLPTEAEWEYTCRAGTTTLWSHGSNGQHLASFANLADATGYKASKKRLVEYIRETDGWGFTAPVGQYKPNAFGLYDMHGNVSEWCHDWFDAEYYQRLAGKTVENPNGPQEGHHRVIRGGSWYDSPKFLRSSYRDGRSPVRRSCFIGFRVVLEPESK